MSNKSEIPPAVAEFAISERQQLLARIEEQAREIARLREALEDIEGQMVDDDGSEYSVGAARAALSANHSERVREVSYKRKFECLAEHAKRQDQVISEMRYDENIRRFYDDGAVWFWAGDETDNLETLACPVVINAGDLRAMLAAAPSAGSQDGASGPHYTAHLDVRDLIKDAD